MLYAILIRPHFWYWCYGILNIHKTMVDKIIKLERKIVKTMLGLPKSTDNKVIELFTSQYSWNNSYNIVNKATEELMVSWEQRDIKKIQQQKKKFSIERADLKKQYPQKLEITIND